MVAAQPVPLVQLVLMAVVAQLDLPEKQVLKDQVVLQVPLEPREPTVEVVQQDQRVPPVPTEEVDQQVHLELQVLTVDQVPQVQRVLQVI